MLKIKEKPASFKRFNYFKMYNRYDIKWKLQPNK